MDGGTLFGNTTRKPECFKKTFRVTRGTFLYILSRIRQQLERQTVTEIEVTSWLVSADDFSSRVARGANERVSAANE